MNIELELSQANENKGKYTRTTVDKQFSFSKGKKSQHMTRYFYFSRCHPFCVLLSEDFRISFLHNWFALIKGCFLIKRNNNKKGQRYNVHQQETLQCNIEKISFLSLLKQSKLVHAHWRRNGLKFCKNWSDNEEESTFSENFLCCIFSWAWKASFDE